MKKEIQSIYFEESNDNYYIEHKEGIDVVNRKEIKEITILSHKFIKSLFLEGFFDLIPLILFFSIIVLNQVLCLSVFDFIINTKISVSLKFLGICTIFIESFLVIYFLLRKLNKELENVNDLIVKIKDSKEHTYTSDSKNTFLFSNFYKKGVEIKINFNWSKLIEIGILFFFNLFLIVLVSFFEFNSQLNTSLSVIFYLQLILKLPFLYFLYCIILSIPLVFTSILYSIIWNVSCLISFLNFFLILKKTGSLVKTFHSFRFLNFKNFEKVLIYYGNYNYEIAIFQLIIVSFLMVFYKLNAIILCLFFISILVFLFIFLSRIIIKSGVVDISIIPRFLKSDFVLAEFISKEGNYVLLKQMNSDLFLGNLEWVEKKLIRNNQILKHCPDDVKIVFDSQFYKNYLYDFDIDEYERCREDIDASIRIGKPFVYSKLKALEPTVIRNLQSMTNLDFLLKIVALKLENLEYFNRYILDNDEFAIRVLEVNGLALRYLNFRFRFDVNYVLKAIQNNGLALMYANEIFRSNRDIVLSAVKNNGEAILYVSDLDLLKDIEIVSVAVMNYKSAIYYADQSLRGNKEIQFLSKLNDNIDDEDFQLATCITNRNILLFAVNINGLAIKFADDSLKNDVDIVLAAVRNNGLALQYVDDSLRKDEYIVLAAVRNNGYSLKFASDELRKDVDIVLTAVINYGFALLNADDNLKKDKDIVLAAVKNNGDVLQFVDEIFKKDKEIVLIAIKSKGNTLKFADESLRKDKEIVLVVVSNYGDSLKYADESLLKDKEIVLAAVSNNGYALQYADVSLRNDKEIVLAAVSNNGYALQYADQSLRKDKEIVLIAIVKGGVVLKHVDESLKKDKEIVLAAVRNNGNALQYADESLRRDKSFILKCIDIAYIEKENIHETLKNDKQIQKALARKQDWW